MTSNVHESPIIPAAARLPSVSSSLWRSVLKETSASDEPAPQGGSGTGGRTTVTGKGRKPDVGSGGKPPLPSVNSSTNSTSVAPVAPVLVTVKRRTTSALIAPGSTTGSGARVPASRNSLVKMGAGSAKRSSDAVLPSTGEPSTVASIVPVILV